MINSVHESKKILRFHKMKEKILRVFFLLFLCFSTIQAKDDDRADIGTTIKQPETSTEKTTTTTDTATTTTTTSNNTTTTTIDVNTTFAADDTTTVNAAKTDADTGNGTTTIANTAENNPMSTDTTTDSATATTTEETTTPSVKGVLTASRDISSMAIVNNQFSSSSSNSEKCDSGMSVELKSPLHLESKLPQSGNISWSDQNLESIECVSEFVVMFRYLESESASASVLCPGYKIGNQNETFWCEYSFSEMDCSKEIEIMIEAWTFSNEMIQPKGKTVIDCDPSSARNRDQEDGEDGEEDLEDEEDEEEDGDESNEPGNNTYSSEWQFPLVLASLNLLQNAAFRNSTPEDGCTWSTWTQWSSCSLTCGGRGVRTRDRGQIGSKLCTGKEQDKQDCITNLCSSDCEWAKWAEWSSCSMTCGRGVRKRIRKIASHAKHGGKKCLTDTDSEEEECLEDDCPVDGVWSTWTRWGYCSRTCGIGSRMRSRRCTEPEPQFGGKPCPGADSETKQCFRLDCPAVDGGWSPWGRWSKCSNTCGSGEQKRYRSCTAPIPTGGGRMCTGDKMETNPCILRNCEVEPYNLLSRKRNPVLSRFNTRINHRLETTEKPAEPEQVIEESTCQDVPYVIDYNDPQVLAEGIVKYTCSKGLVVDTLTNRRFHFIPCARFPMLNSSLLPRCQAATHCVGPAPKPGEEDEAYLPLPRRDVPVNSNTRYTCKNGLEDFVSCFYDGVYRRPSILCSANETDLAENETFRNLSSSSYGWLTGPGYPVLANLTSSDWTLVAPHGHAIALGIEDIRPGSDTKGSFLQFVESYHGEEKVTELSGYHIGNVWRSFNNTVTVRFLETDFERNFRISYIVIDHVNYNKYKTMF